MKISFVPKVVNYKKSSVRIVYYHIISNNNPEYYFPNKALGVEDFRRQIKFFKKNFQVIKLDEALNLAFEGKSLKNKLVITFDDGFKENYSVIAPILDEEKISATFFMISSCLDNKDLMWRNKVLLFEKYKTEDIRNVLYGLSEDFNLPKVKENQSILEWSFSAWPMNIKEDIVNRLWKLAMPMKISEYLEKHTPYCTSKEVKELHDSGFGIGSHSHTHPIFSKLTYEDFSDEILTCASRLSSIIGDDVFTFSYPFGNRASKDFEDKFHAMQPNNWTFLGTKNRLNNFANNYKEWERDNIEYTNFQMKIRFLYLPIYRSLNH